MCRRYAPMHASPFGGARRQKKEHHCGASQNPACLGKPTSVRLARPRVCPQKDGLRFLWQNLVDDHRKRESQDDSQGHDPLKAGGAILAHVMGLGKSLTTVAFIHTVFAYEHEGRALIVTPANVSMSHTHTDTHKHMRTQTHTQAHTDGPTWQPLTLWPKHYWCSALCQVNVSLCVHVCVCVCVRLCLCVLTGPVQLQARVHSLVTPG